MNHNAVKRVHDDMTSEDRQDKNTTRDIRSAAHKSSSGSHRLIFASGFLEAGYRRFIERRLRETFGFEGTPITISVRVREKRRR